MVAELATTQGLTYLACEPCDWVGLVHDTRSAAAGEANAHNVGHHLPAWLRSTTAPTPSTEETR